MYMIWTQVTWIECFIHRQAIYMEESLSHLLLFLANFCKCQWYEHPPAPYNSARKISTYTIPFSSYQLYPWYFQMLMYVIIIPHAHFADRSIFIVQKKNIATFFLIIFLLLDNARESRHHGSHYKWRKFVTRKCK